jgi:GT2 family glycosyltransferase
MTTQAPRVSLIIPAYHSEKTAPACLRALEAQTYRDFETILVDSAPGWATARLARDQFPWVSAHESPQRLLPHAARNFGVQFARGSILVFTDPDCEARPDWLARLVAAHDAGHPVAGGSVAAPRGWWQLAVHMGKFSWWLPGGPEGPRPDLVTANSSYRRDLFDKVGGFLGDRFCGDSELNWRVKAAGELLWFVPSAIVSHHHEGGFLPAMRERFKRGADYGRTRVERQHWSRARRLLYLAILPVLPLVVTARSFLYAARNRHAFHWLITFPVHFSGNIAWCAGEAKAHAA